MDNYKIEDKVYFIKTFNEKYFETNKKNSLKEKSYD